MRKRESLWRGLQTNRASGTSIMVAAFISALFLSLLCSLFYNFWVYEMEKIVLEEGDWQVRITGAIDEEDLRVIENFANVKKVAVDPELSEGETVVAELSFWNMKTIYEDMPLIAEKLGLQEDAVSYHELLLSRYMVHDPQDETPPLLMAFYLAFLFVMSLSLVLIIHNSFAVSMNARVRQFGIFSSIGATPGQIFACLMQEAAALCILPILIGSLAGVGLCFGTLQVINAVARGMAGRHEAVFSYHPLVLVVTLTAAILTVFVSAWLPAGKLSRLTPLEAIRSAGELSLKKKRDSRLLALWFGMEGELAGNALAAQKRALRTSTLSLTLSFLGFTVMLCFFTLTGISTNHTYFERYQDAWDVMVTLKDTGLGEWDQGEEIAGLPGVESSVAYQKAEALCVVSQEELSKEVQELGGPEAMAGSAVTRDGNFYVIKAPIVILDDAGFAEYCGQLGVEANLGGCIVQNRIWDSQNSNFRYKEYVPFLKEDRGAVTVKSAAASENAGMQESAAMVENAGASGDTGLQGNAAALEIPVLAYAQSTPVLREEYANYALVQFIPLSLWKQISGRIGNTEPDTCVRVLGKEGMTLAGLTALEEEIFRILDRNYTVETENRIQEKMTDDAMRRGSMWILGAFCTLLAVIGIANVFSNTLGFLRQRKREFARYVSVGLTPKGMRKMFAIEVLLIAGRPVLITIPLTAAVVGFMITASYLDPMEFLEKAPILPIVLFIAAIFAFVALAYYIGAGRLFHCDLSEALREDELM